MKYGIIKKNRVIKYRVFFIFSVLFFIFSVAIYLFDRIIEPNIIKTAEIEMEARAGEIFIESAMEVYRENFKYEDFFHIERDNEGLITMIAANTIEMGYLAALIASSSQVSLREIGELGIDFPLGYLSKNNLLSTLGPRVKIKMQPLGSISTSYASSFETAGINQTRHRIILRVHSKIKIILPLKSTVIEYYGEIPVIETIIVGRVPRTNLGIDGLEIK